MKNLAFLTGRLLLGCYMVFLVSSESTCQTQPTQEPNYWIELAQKEAEINSLEQTWSQEELNREGGPKAQLERWKAKWAPRADENGSYSQYFINTEQALQQIQSMEVVSADNWVELGPTEHPNSNRLTTVGGGDFGPGPIEFIQFYESQPDLILCGSTSGGLYVSNNAGLSWQNAGTDQGWEISGCGWAEFRPGYPNTWYGVNAGQGSTGQEDIGLGALYRTTNAGSNWSEILDHTLIGLYTTVHKFKVNTTSTNNMIVATENGVFVSNNINEPIASDVNWQQLEFPLGEADNRSVVFDIVYIPNDGFYATLCDDSYSNFTVIRSTTNGATWTQLDNQPQNLNNHWRVTLSTSNSNDNLLVVFGIRSGGLDDVHNLYQVDLSGDTWTSVNTPIPAETVDMGSGKAFCVSHQNVNQIFVGTLFNTLRYTADGGLNWGSNTAGSGDLWHVDLEDIVSHPTNNNEVWIATHGGVYRSIDGGITFVRRSSGLGVGQVWSISTESLDYSSNILISRYHGGSSQLTGGSTGWMTVTGGDGQVSLISDINPDHQYTASQRNNWIGTGDSWNSVDGFTGDRIAPTFNEEPWRSNGEIDAFNPEIVYHSAWSVWGTGLRRTTDGGVSSFTIEDFAGLYGQMPNTQLNAGSSGRLHSSLAKKGTLYAATKYVEDGENRVGLLRTRVADHTDPNVVVDSWEHVILPNFDEVNWGVSGIATNPENENELYIVKAKSVYNNSTQVNSQAVYRFNLSLSSSHPDYVRDITYNLPPFIQSGDGRNGIVFEKGTNGNIYVRGGELGLVFFTNNRLLEDDSEPWKVLGSGVPHVAIYAMDIDYGTNKLRIGSSGRGVWEHDLYCPEDQNLVLTGTLNSNEFYEASSTISSTENISPGISSSCRAGYEIVLNPGFIAEQGSVWHGFIHGCDSQGNSFRLANPDQNGNESNGSMISESAESVDLAVTPNPNSGSFIIAGSSLQQVIITDATGKLVRQINGGLRTQLQIEGLSSGLYLVRAQMADGSVENGRVIVN